MRSKRLFPILILAALVLPLIRTAALAGDDFSAQAVFARSEASNIDDRCLNARDFAKEAAQSTADLDAVTAVAGEHAFFNCFYMKRLNPDPEDMRYLLLGAAAAAYLAATKTDGQAAITLFHQADDMAAALGATSPDRPWNTYIEATGAPGAGQAPAQTGSTQGPTRYIVVVQRDVFGASHALKYSDVATKLEQAITKSLATLAAPGGSSAPAPAASAPAAAPR